MGGTISAAWPGGAPGQRRRPHLPLPLRASRYHTSQRAAPRTIASPVRHEKACWNAGRFESGPTTRYLAIGCGSPWTVSRCVSGRIL